MARCNGEDFHIAAFLYRNGKLIRIGINGSKCSPRFVRHYKNGIAYSAHAEMDALSVAKPGDTLIVIRWLKNGERVMAKPCRFCQSKIKQAKLSSVKYTNIEGKFEIL